MSRLSRASALAAAWILSAAAVAAPLPDNARARQALAGLDAPFEGNIGQYDARVAYAARTFAGTTFVTHDGLIVHALRGAPGSTGWNLVESLVGAAAARPSPAAPSSTAVTRLGGRWQGNIPTFGAISLGEPWQGIEMSLKAKGANVEKLFTVAPGASAARIRVSFAGAQSLRVDESGALVAATEAGAVRFTAPIAWQQVGGEQRAVAVTYVTAGAEYGFTLGPHDPEVAVVIDPVLQSTYLGGSSPFDEIAGMALDAAGNVYVAGGTSSFDFPGTAGGAQPTPAGFGVYVAKLNPTLTTLIQSTYLGGQVNESVGGLVVNAAGEVLVAGWTSSSVFPGTTGAAQSVYGGGPFDGFVTQLAGNLQSIIRTTFVGGTGDDQIAGIAIDAAGNIVVAGRTTSTDLAGTAGSAQATNRGTTDGFVARLTGDLGTLVRSTYLGGTGLDSANAIAIDAAGLVYVAGSTTSADFSSVAGGAQATYGGSEDAFVARLAADLTTFSQVTYLGGDSNDFATAVSVGAAGTIYVAGLTRSANLPGVAGGAVASKPNTGTNITSFVTRFATGLTSIMQSTYLGGSASDTVRALAIDGAGIVNVAGQGLSTTLPGPGGAGTGAAFISRLATNLTSVTRTLRMGAGASDSVTRLAFDSAGNLVVGGFTGGGIPGTAGGAQPTIAGLGYSSVGDGFISRLTNDLLPGPATRFEVTAPASTDIGVSFTVTVTAYDAAGIIATGYAGTVRITTSAGSATLPPNATLTNGVRTFNVTLLSPGSHTVTATDTVTAAITGTSPAITVTGQLATNFTVTAPASTPANAAISVTVTARDSGGAVVTNYAGSVNVTSTDPAATLPGAGAFVNGVRTFNVTLRTAGNRTVTVTDTVTPSITGTSAAINVTQQLHLTVTAPTPRIAGTATTITVTARDPAEAVVTSYAGTVEISSSDGAATLPANATLVNGTRTFNVTLRTAGNQTVTASDTVNAAVTDGSAPIVVTPAAAASLTIAAPASATPDVAFNVTVAARDAFNNAATGYTGTVRITSTDGAATLPANAALVAGTRVFSVTLRTGGNHTVTATDIAAPSLTVTSGTIAVSRLSQSASALDFGGQSMSTTSPPLTVTVSNPTASPITISNVAVSSAQFPQTNNCATLAAGGACTVTLTFKPAVAAGAVGASIPVSGTLTLTSASGNVTVSLAGQAEKSLVTHYYRAILRRAPDAGGKTFWSNETTRVATLGLNVNETWFAMAQTFYSGAEYAAFNRDNTGYVTDLYNTFFNRAPDSGGLAYWVGQLASGLPREVALPEFMFSTEFRNFSQAIFGNTAVRAEIDALTDFYRGLLSRLPDNGGFNFWLLRFRTAQCQGPAAINAEVEAISSSFATGAEYTARARNNSQYVGDLYNAFLRRGGDLAGVNSWIGQLTSGAQTREQERVAFKNSAEFQARVSAIIAQGCL